MTSDLERARQAVAAAREEFIASVDKLSITRAQKECVEHYAGIMVETIGLAQRTLNALDDMDDAEAQA